MPNKTKLPLKQELFCRLWVENMGNGAQAALGSFNIKGKELLSTLKPTDKRAKKIKNTAGAMASEYLRKPNILKRIDEILDESGLDDKSIKRVHYRLLHFGKDEIALKALIECYKLKGKYKNAQQSSFRVTKVDLPDNLDQMSTLELLDLEMKIANDFARKG